MLTTSIMYIILGFILLIKGADILVDGSSNLARKFHIPDIIIGLTIVSIGTSMPELFVSTTSALDGLSDVAMGNVIGSNVCNLLLILGLSALIKPVKFQRETRLIEISMCLIFTVIFMAICNINADVSKAESIMLLTLFILFIGYTIYMGKKGEEFDKKGKECTALIERPAEYSVPKCIGFIILGIIGLKIGGDWTVDNAMIIANHFNVSEKIISLTILAIGTSLPELVTSVMAAIKGNSDIAIGNIIGSNIFNMLLIIGVAAFIKPITYNLTYNIDMTMLMVGTVVLALFPIIPPKNEMSRMNGLVYLGLYAVYMLIMFTI